MSPAVQASRASPWRSTETWGESAADQPDAETFHDDVHAASALIAIVAVTASPAAAATEAPARKRRFQERR
jgi:hypothetical protein